MKPEWKNLTKRARLYEDCSPLLGSQLVVEKCIYAKSADALNDDLSMLGWPPELLKTARHLYLFWEDLGKKRSDLIRWIKDPPNGCAHFDFPDEIDEPETSVFPTRNLISSRGFQLGANWIDDRNCWPFLLREFQLYKEGNHSGRVNSFDYWGMDRIAFRRRREPFDNPLEFARIGGESVSYENDGNVISVVPTDNWQRARGIPEGGNACVMMQVKNLRIIAYNVMTIPVAEFCSGIPRFWKVLFIRDGNPARDEKYDELAIALRQDMHSNIDRSKREFKDFRGEPEGIGSIRFRRYINCNPDGVALMEQNFRIKPDWKICWSGKPQNEAIVTFQRRNWAESSSWTNLIGINMDSLYADYAQVFWRPDWLELDLERMAGKGLLENPPRRLIELFE